MDAEQGAVSNPFGMDENCRNCPGLCDERETVVHGYGDVGAEFLFVAERPGSEADRTGIPFDDNDRFWSMLTELSLATLDGDDPILDNAYVTHLTRCRHPERPPTDDEVMSCEPFLNAEIRMINPEILIPIGQRALVEIGREYTTTREDELDIREHHGASIRGRGFELVPMIHPEEATTDDRDTFIEAFRELTSRDYRQTKGRQQR